MNTSRELPTGQKWLVEYMRSLGYKTNDDGVCFGVAYMAMQALLINQIKQFEERFDAIYADAQVNRQPRHYSTFAFFDSVAVRGKPSAYHYVVDNPYHLSDEAGLEYTLPLFLPSLKKDDEAEDVPELKVVTPLSFSGAYSSDELGKYFASLQEAIDKSGGRPQHPLTLVLSSQAHTICVSYVGGQWLVVNASKLPNICQLYKSAADVTDAVYKAFKSSEHTIISTKCYATDTEETEIKKITSYWQAHQDFKEINALSDSKIAARDYYGGSWLGIAIFNGDKDKVDEMLAMGVDPNQPGVDGYPPLYTAAVAGRADIVRALIRAGARVNDVEPLTGATALVIASQMGCLDVMKELLASGADSNLPRQKTGESPLYLATTNQHHAAAELLLKNHANPDGANKADQLTPVCLAAWKGDERMVKLLLDAGANLNIPRKPEGETPLFFAVANGKNAIAKMLIAKGANPDLACQNGATARGAAEYHGRTEIIAMLKNQKLKSAASAPAESGMFSESAAVSSASSSAKNSDKKSPRLDKKDKGCQIM